MQIFKGYKNVIIRRDFAIFLINHPVAKAFKKFMMDSWTPDEHVYATMSRIQHIDEKTQVDCGKDKAGSCEDCHKDYGDNWCSEDCLLKDHQCVLKRESKFLRFLDMNTVSASLQPRLE